MIYLYSNFVILNLFKHLTSVTNAKGFAQDQGV